MGKRLAEGVRDGNNLTLFVNGHSAGRRFFDPCLAKVEPGETIFVLRSTDKLAPELVRLWADAVEEGGGDKERVAAARAIADDMEKWPKRGMPAGAKETPAKGTNA